MRSNFFGDDRIVSEVRVQQTRTPMSWAHSSDSLFCLRLKVSILTL